MIVAIDGPAGTGKSSVSRCVADSTGFFYLNSGRFYRAITWRALQDGVAMEDSAALINVAKRIAIVVDDEDTFSVDGRTVDRELHSSFVDTHVARVSTIPQLRTEVNRRLLAVAAKRNVVAEGRDVTTVVFPDAEIKIFLDASADIRARRRWHESDKSLSLDEIRRAIVERDQIDRTKKAGRLFVSEDAIYLDTTPLTLAQVCEKVVATIRQKINDIRST